MFSACAAFGMLRNGSLAALLLAAALTTVPASALGQTITGTVRDREGGGPVASAQVVVLDTLGGVVTTVVSGSDGQFRARPGRDGIYRIRVASLGYADAVTDRFTLDPLETLRVDLWLSPQPIGLPALEVRSRRRPLMQNAMLQGFVERREKGWGQFLARDQIEERDVGTMADILRSVPGVTVVKHPAHLGWYLIRINRAAPALRSFFRRDDCLRSSAGCQEGDPERLAQEQVTGGCPPVFYVDGAKVHDAGYVTEILNVTSPVGIEAIEVYRGAGEMPAEFGGSDARCGVVVIWTRRGTQ